MTNSLRFAVIGAGFWTRFQLSGWREIGGTNCVAICNRTRSKADDLAREFGISQVYDNPEDLLDNEDLDFVDVITGVDTHKDMVLLAAKHGLPVICQKPMATSLPEAVQMVDACRRANVPLLINENWRWQAPIREVKRLLQTGDIGHPFRARIDMISGYPVVANQPFLGTIDQFILADLGSHILDVARFLFGEARRVYCQTQKVDQHIKGENVATVMMSMDCGTTVVAEMAYAENYLERDRFPETCIFIEGDRGSLELSLDFSVRVTSSKGTLTRRVPPPRFSWADPAYDIVHSSIVPCQTNLLKSLLGEECAETTGVDNLKTTKLVFASYESALTGQAVWLE